MAVLISHVQNLDYFALNAINNIVLTHKVGEKFQIYLNIY